MDPGVRRDDVHMLSVKVKFTTERKTVTPAHAGAHAELADKAKARLIASTDKHLANAQELLI